MVIWSTCLGGDTALHLLLLACRCSVRRTDCGSCLLPVSVSHKQESQRRFLVNLDLQYDAMLRANSFLFLARLFLFADVSVNLPALCLALLWQTHEEWKTGKRGQNNKVAKPTLTTAHVIFGTMQNSRKVQSFRHNVPLWRNRSYWINFLWRGTTPIRLSLACW